MRICIDMRWARPGRPDGIGTYVHQLAPRLLALPSGHEWVLLFEPGDASRDTVARLKEGAAGPVRIVDTPTRLLTAADWRRLPRWLASEGIALFHSPYFLVSPFHRGRGQRVVVTVHDLSPLARRRFAKGESLRWRLFFSIPWLTAACLDRVDAILADSEATRADLARIVGIRERVDVVPLGVEPASIWPAEAEGGARGRVGDPLPPRFLLYVGRQDPQKNLDGLIHAYARLGDGIRRAHPLLVCGPADPRFEPRLRAMAASLGVGDGVRFLGALPRTALAGAYRRASLLVHPSHQEGFGLTVLEAMSFGLPVVALRVPAIEEIAGGVARLVEPGVGEEAALTAEIERLLGDEGERARLAVAGRARAALYTWERCARATIEVYERVLGEGGRRAGRH